MTYKSKDMGDINCLIEEGWFELDMLKFLLVFENMYCNI